MCCASVVLAVVAYHFGYTWLYGEFLGVDLCTATLSRWFVLNFLSRIDDATGVGL